MPRHLLHVAQAWDSALSNFASLRWIVTILLTVVVVLLFNRLLGMIIPPIVKAVSQRADTSDSTEKMLRWRRLETFLSLVLTVAKLLFFVIALYLAWKIFNPKSAPVAVVGAGAIFVVLASATVGPLLRDITYGIIMIAERWYNVGDHIEIEPFGNLGGVVEQVTLRSTKLRSLNGQIIWLHNQHIQAVKITPRGVKTLAIDVFVSDVEKGRKIVEKAIAAVPSSATMVSRKLKIFETEQLAETLWRISVIGQTAPGREWLIEDFAVKAINQYDKTNIIVHGPIVRFADEAAERRFKRAVRAKSS